MRVETRLPAEAVLLFGYLVPAAGLVAAFPERRALGLALFGLWALVAWALTAALVRERRAAQGRPLLLAPTAAKVVGGPVIAAMLALGCCYWPAHPPHQGQSGWISFSDWPAVVLLLGQHPLPTGLFLLVIGYSTGAAILAIARRRDTGDVRTPTAIISLNLLVLVLATAVYSSISARRF